MQPPEVISLLMRIGAVSLTHAQNVPEKRWLRSRRASKLQPVLALTATDHIINRRRREPLVIEMAVDHKDRGSVRENPREFKPKWDRRTGGLQAQDQGDG